MEFDKTTETFQYVNTTLSIGRGAPGLTVVDISDISASLSGCKETGEVTTTSTTSASTTTTSPVLTPTRNNLIGTLPLWGPLFEISFDLWVESFASSYNGGWSEFLRFTTTDSNCCVEGARLPAFQANLDGSIYIITQIGGDYNAHKGFEFTKKTWRRLTVKQYLNNKDEVKINFSKYKQSNNIYVSRPFSKCS